MHLSPLSRRSFLKTATIASTAASFPVRAGHGGLAAGTNFDVASGLPELCLLSNVAVRARRPLEWDSAAMKVTHFPEANSFVN
jgi:hypothetical protein